MTVADLLAEVGRHGVALRPGDGGRIVARPAGLLPDDLKDEIRAHRDEVLAALTVPPGPWVPCSTCGKRSGFTFSAEDPTVRCLCGDPRRDPCFAVEEVPS